MRQPTMHFWKIEELKSNLLQSDLGSALALQYLVVGGGLYMLFAAIPLPDRNFWDHVDLFSEPLFFALGTIYAFRRNGGPEGRDFVGRFLALSWVLGIRFGALVYIPAIVFVIFVQDALFGAVPDDSTPVESVVFAVINISFYLRLGRHFHDLRAPAAA